MASWRERALRPLDNASLAVFRIFFGLLMAAGVVRFWARGWIEQLYLAPSMHFKYWGFGWVEVPPAPLLYGLFALLGLASLCIALGLFYRLACAVFFLGFTYVELLDKATYLNHYYLVSLLACLMLFLPLHRRWSLDARRLGERTAAPAWVLWTLRAQVGLVYLFAGLAKLGPDWLLRGQPLATWLAARELPLFGSLLATPPLPLAMAWAGMLFDMSLPFLLLWRRTRVPAFCAGLVFHTVTGLLFPLGLFPWIMVGCTTLFFAPDWPSRRRVAVVAPVRRFPRLAWLLLPWFVVQLALPLRGLLYPGNSLWSEEGFRFSWRVMLVEKTGLLRFRVRAPDGRRWVLRPEDECLTPMQAQQLVGQPDMILELAHRIAARFAASGLDVEVRADAWVAFNGRRSRRLIDPQVDLAKERDSLAPKPWILPLE